MAGCSDGDGDGYGDGDGDGRRRLRRRGRGRGRWTLRPVEFGYAAAMWFEPGRVITRRYLRGCWCTWAQAMRVIGDDEHGLLLWQPAGGDFATLVDAEGRTPHEVTPDQMRDPRLAVRSWQGDVLILMTPQTHYSV
jgi:hypothetical protein